MRAWLMALLHKPLPVRANPSPAFVRDGERKKGAEEGKQISKFSLWLSRPAWAACPPRAAPQVHTIDRTDMDYNLPNRGSPNVFGGYYSVWNAQVDFIALISSFLV